MSDNKRFPYLAAFSMRYMLRSVLVFIAILCSAAGTLALTLGNVRGVVLVGKPVSLTVPVTLDAGETASATCTEVEVSFADARLDAGRVRVAWAAPDAVGNGQLKIQTTVAVDEPVITVLLRAGCARKSERRYVLLADVVTDPNPAQPMPVDSLVAARAPVVAAVQAPTAARIAETEGSIGSSSPGRSANLPDIPVAQHSKATPATAVAEKSAINPQEKSPRMTEPAAPVALPGASAQRPVTTAPVPAPAASAATVAKTSASAPALRASAPKAMSVASAPKPVAPESPAPTVAPAMRAADATPVKPRLKLEALPEFSPVLRSSFSLIAPATENLQAREDARILWRVLNAGPDQLLADLQRVRKLEEQAKVLQADKDQAVAAQADLKARLDKAEEDLYSNWLVGLLGALFVGASSIAGYLWWRNRTQTSWSPKDMWHGQSVEPSNMSDLAAADSLMSEAAVIGKSRRFGKRPGKSMIPDVDLGVDESLFDSLKASSLQQSSHMESIPTGAKPFVHSMSARTVNVEELFDIQQQAEFFVSLGQFDQAIELLRQHIDTNKGTSGIAYLDLLKIYHKLDHRSEYGQLREEFNKSFNAKVPPFDKFGEMQRRGLERYPSAMARIETLWKSPRILSVLQEAIFRRPDAGDAECFDLEAYRDLMLLFSVAKEASGVSAGVTTMGHTPRPETKDASPNSGVTNSMESMQTMVQSRFNATQSWSEPPNSGATADDDARSAAVSTSPSVDVNLFDLESGHADLGVLDAEVAQTPSHIGPSERVKASVVAVSAALAPLPPPESTLAPLDFSLSLPPEFSTPESTPVTKPTSGLAPLAFDLSEYGIAKELPASDSTKN